jgi:quercetin dioxygenase-like cupin family protein
MGRPSIEFVQSQMFEWELTAASAFAEVFPDAEAKVLSTDDQTGAQTALVRVQAGWEGPTDIASNTGVEIFVLEGGLQIGGFDLQEHDYLFLPAHLVRGEAHSRTGATLLVFTHDPGAPAQDPIHTRTRALAWDTSNIDPNINHLGVARKNLRLDPKGACRTYLLGGMPQGYAAAMVGRKERHPTHVEEFFVVSGEIRCSMVGIMRKGGYFWRPPGKWHGLDCSPTGFLLFCRTPGSNVTVSEWSEECHPIDPDPPYQPDLPAALAHLAGRYPKSVDQY